MGRRYTKTTKNEMQNAADIILATIKNDPLLPKDTGYLRDNIISEVHYYKQEVIIQIPGSKVKYAQYLQNGTGPHDIPHAFGYGSKRPSRRNPYTGRIPYGKGGRFNGKWHPGSTKHAGFVDYVLLNDTIDYFYTHYDVEHIDMGNMVYLEDYE